MLTCPLICTTTKAVHPLTRPLPILRRKVEEEEDIKNVKVIESAIEEDLVVDHPNLMSL
jgi:hypothetical protein